MSRVKSLHLNDFDTNSGGGSRPDRTRLVAIAVTAGIVVVAGLLVVALGDNSPRSVPVEPAADSATAAPGAEQAVNGAESAGAKGAGASEKPSMTIPAGTALRLEIADPVPGADVAVGSEVVATLVAPLEVDGAIAVPAGARVVGRVTETIELGENRGNAVYGVTFDRIEADGQSTSIVAALKDRQLDLAPGRLLDLELADAAQVPVAPDSAG